MDRLDYLKRDSFYTGVAEGNINAERLITMLNVIDGELVVEEKGIYSVEKFLMARRFMYWQVYLHKTSLVAEQLLIRILKRARQLMKHNENLHCSEALRFFIQNRIAIDKFDSDTLDMFAKLDDIDVMSAIKEWQEHPDFVLSRLCRMIINRKLLHIKLKDCKFKPAKLQLKHDEMKKRYGLTNDEAAYFVFSGKVENQAYNPIRQNIIILSKNGKMVDAAVATDHLNLKVLSKTVIKYYRCYPKDFD